MIQFLYFSADRHHQSAIWDFTSSSTPS